MKLSVSGILFALALVLSGPARAEWIDAATEACIERHFNEAPAEMTLGELRERCSSDSVRSGEPVVVAPELPEDTPVLTRRLEQERAIEGRAWTILPHRPNFILPYSYNSAFDRGFYSDLGYSDADALKDYEAIFQVSMKVPVWYGLTGDNGDVYFAFTSRAWWQVFAGDEASAPFRETNYEPELFVRYNNDWEFLGFRNTLNSFGLVHQSNGRDEPVSRSWNRLYASFLFEKENFSFRIKPWYRLPEDEEDDDNKNIERWLGYADYSFAWAPGDHRFFANVRNNLKSWDENKGSVEFTYSYPLWGGLRLYLQYFNGYGDGLIYYNENTNRFGVGIALNDVL
jgi:phospholipase A1